VKNFFIDGGKRQKPPKASCLEICLRSCLTRPMHGPCTSYGQNTRTCFPPGGYNLYHRLHFGLSYAPRSPILTGNTDGKGYGEEAMDWKQPQTPWLPHAPKSKRTTTWREFIRTHLDVLVATGSFTAEVATLGGHVTYYVFFFIRLGSRKIHGAGFTPHPHEVWMVQVVRNVTMERRNISRG
jgi:hypothetical protein